MQNYPTVKEQPNKKQRKSARKRTFAANQDAMKIAREARRTARKGINK